MAKQLPLQPDQPEQGGRIANYTGNVLEKFVQDRLDERGYAFVTRDKFEAAKYIGQPIYTKQLLIGQSIYENNLFSDFVIYHPTKHANCLIIEVKWQQSAGSVDEKYPYLILNINMKFPYDTVLLLDGGGYTKGAEKWVRKQVGNKLKHVFNMSEFQIWANKGKI